MKQLKTLIGSAFVALSTLFAVNADATHITATVTTVNAGSMSPTSTCVAGNFAAGWQTPGTGYWDYTMSTTGFTGITMTFKNMKSSAGGPTLGSIYYNIGGSDVFISSFVPSTSCPTNFTVVNLPVACENVGTVHIKVKMTGATNNTATHRITADPFDGTSSACTGTPASGSITGAGAICAGTSATLTLSGAGAGGGITYQWQSSPNNSTWSNIAGATNTTYNTPLSLSASTYYRVVVTCPNSGMSANTASVLETINTVSFGAFTGLNSNFVIVGDTDTIACSTPAGGVWSSSNTSRATIDAVTGQIVAKKGGVVVLSYNGVDAGTGCAGHKDTTINIVWPNTLALYAGDNGNSTNVIAIPGETAGNVTATGFGTATPCTVGGFSGLTVPVTVTSYNSATGPYISYIVTPNAGQALNIRRIVAGTRESGTGPAKARIAYRINGGSWIDEGRDVTQNVGGSCGAASTTWDFTDVNGNNPTINGITTNIEVAVFPYAPGASTGTFQLNTFEIYGLITSSTPCSGTPNAGSINETHVRLCDSGSYWLNFTGDAGVGISYQWQSSTDNISFTNIPGATGASYNTGMLHSGTNPRTFYRVVTSCSGGSSNNSPADTVDVTATPSAGTITGIPTPFMHSGDVVSLGATGGTPGGTIAWSSNDTTAVAIDRTTGQITGLIPGFARITRINTVNGCSGFSFDSVRNILPATIAVYVGKFGSSLSADYSASVSGSNITKVGSFGSTTPCSFGGTSGMTTTVTSYNSSNPHVSLSFQALENLTIQDFAVTLRRSNNGPFFARLAYRVNGGSWNDDGIDQSVDVDGCGYSQNVLGYSFSTPLTLNNGDNVEFAVFPYNDAAQSTGGSFQVNTIDITSSDASNLLRQTSVTNVVKAETIKLFPNPATSVLNVVAAENVNVTILSIDGKKLIEQKNATSINISSLANGLYLIQIADANNNLIETAKFTKQ